MALTTAANYTVGTWANNANSLGRQLTEADDDKILLISGRYRAGGDAGDHIHFSPAGTATAMESGR